jgi:GTP-binding protein
LTVNNIALAATAVAKKQYPESDKPEIAFVGKSNVGKSSLINALANRKKLARVSQTPGKTRTINFYLVENLFYFVDLPGYGYAKASISEIIKWGQIAETYLTQRKQLKEILFLIDIRHPPGSNDMAALEWIRYFGYALNVVLTKADKLNKRELAKNVLTFKETLGVENPIPFSSLKKTGFNELWDLIENRLYN